MPELAPETIELHKKRKIVDRLSDRLADREEEMADLRGELDQFEARYKMEVGRFYAELDEIEASIAEEEVKLVPDDEEIKKKAEELRRKAEESAAEAETDERAADRKFSPTPEARKAYHDLARVIHPDLALDPSEKAKRHELMAKLNDAYSAGDQQQLDRLAADYRTSPEAVSGDSIGDDLVRAIRQIAQIRGRLAALKKERSAAERSELFELYQKVNDEFAEGRDLLQHMAARTKTFIKKSTRRLENLRNVNKAAEEHVKKRYGMDIKDFRDPGAKTRPNS